MGKGRQILRGDGKIIGVNGTDRPFGDPPATEACVDGSMTSEYAKPAARLRQHAATFGKSTNESTATSSGGVHELGF